MLAVLCALLSLGILGLAGGRAEASPPSPPPSQTRAGSGGDVRDGDRDGSAQDSRLAGARAFSADPPRWWVRSTIDGSALALTVTGLVGALAVVAVRTLRRQEPPVHRAPAPPSHEPATMQASPASGTERSTRDDADRAGADGEAPATDDQGLGEVGAARALRSDPTQRSAGHPPDAAQLESTSVVLYDRRLGQRVAYESTARFQWDGHDVAGATVDLSMTGVRCNLPAGTVLRPGADLRVTLLLNGALGVFSARAQWVRSSDVHLVVGLQFLEVTATEQTLLEPVILGAGS